MAAFDPVTALIGGALIGLAAALMMLMIGRVAGVSGIVGGLISDRGSDRIWRLAFVAGLIAAPFLTGLTGYALPTPEMPRTWTLVIIGGLLVGFGSRLGSGCTSGHGVCGIARISPRSIAATLVFMISAMITVAIMRHGIGG